MNVLVLSKEVLKIGRDYIKTYILCFYQKLNFFPIISICTFSFSSSSISNMATTTSTIRGTFFIFYAPFSSISSRIKKLNKLSRFCILSYCKTFIFCCYIFHRNIIFLCNITNCISRTIKLFSYFTWIRIIQQSLIN